MVIVSASLAGARVAVSRRVLSSGLGARSGGVLTVTDGTHTANITLKGDYRGVTFVASKDGHGGTEVVVRKADAFVAPVDAFISAMAGLGSPGGQAIHADVAGPGREHLLAPARAAPS